MLWCSVFRKFDGVEENEVVSKRQVIASSDKLESLPNLREGKQRPSTVAPPSTGRPAYSCW